MNNDAVEIELDESNVTTPSHLTLPQNFKLIGNLDSEDVRVYIHQNVYKEIEKFSASNVKIELGSILIGSYTEEMGKTHVVISNFIEAKYTDASQSTLTFTHETWDFIHATHAELYPNEKIVGWQHTHPNYGIFLSNYDLFIQHNFFNSAFQIAYVVDPIQKTRGFFQWKNDKVTKLEGYYVYDSVGKTIDISKLEAVPKNKEVKTSPVLTKSKSGVLYNVAILLLVAALGWSLWNIYTNQNKFNLKVNEKIAQQDQQIKNLESATNVLFPSGQVDVEPSQGDVYFDKYIVKENDNLGKILQLRNLKSANEINLVLRINGIENPDFIYPGQILIIPVDSKN